MKTTSRRTRLQGNFPRNGIAAVECAVVAPLLILLVLGAIDVGQYANVCQKISDASREGARVAARHDTVTSSQVQAAVIDYLEKVAFGTSSSAYASAAQVVVTDAFGKAIPGGDLTKIATGSQVNVRVTLDYAPVRWHSGFKGLDGRQIVTTTMMRRE
jgi:Flp pilus assembly protein TadG